MNEFTEQLLFIRKAQKEFQMKFNRKLVVDLIATKGLYEEDTIDKQVMEDKLKELANEYGADLDKLRFHHCKADSPEQLVIKAFCRLAVTNRWNQELAAKVINRNRTIFIYNTNYVINGTPSNPKSKSGEYHGVYRKVRSKPAPRQEK